MRKPHERISEYLQEQGIKQRFVAEKIGVADAVVSQMLNGNRKISADEYELICIALEKEPNDFMTVTTQD